MSAEISSSIRGKPGKGEIRRWKTEETSILAEGSNHASWIRSQKIEGTPGLLEMGPNVSGPGGASTSGKKQGRGGKNEEIPVLAEGLPLPAFLEGQMQPAYDGDTHSPFAKKRKGRSIGGKNEETPILAEGPREDIARMIYSTRISGNSGSLLEAHRNLCRFH